MSVIPWSEVLYHQESPCPLGIGLARIPLIVKFPTQKMTCFIFCVNLYPKQNLDSLIQLQSLIYVTELRQPMVLCLEFLASYIHCKTLSLHNDLECINNRQGGGFKYNPALGQHLMQEHGLYGISKNYRETFKELQQDSKNQDSYDSCLAFSGDCKGC